MVNEGFVPSALFTFRVPPPVAVFESCPFTAIYSSVTRHPVDESHRNDPFRPCLGQEIAEAVTFVSLALLIAS